ncbi:uncharacterized protein TNCV_2376171 [Trichonephila clavipes]|nr:uncharacterized protein TNCV_2376171 [Trichonephila clavipes]
MMDRIFICEVLAKRNEIDPFPKWMVTGDKKWLTHDNIARKRSWLKRGEAAQTVAKPGLTSRKLHEGFGDGSRNFEPWSSDVDDTGAGTPLRTTTPHHREDVSALDSFNVHRCPTRRVFSGTELELVTRQATIQYLYHSATAATSTKNLTWYCNVDSLDKHILTILVKFDVRGEQDAQMGHCILPSCLGVKQMRADPEDCYFESTPPPSSTL